MARGEQEQICFDFVKDYLNKNSLPSFEDVAILRKMFQTAIPNPIPSDFPDFICDSGFIEHFQVSAANENRKGSKHNITISDFEKSNEEALEQEKIEFEQLPARKSPKPDTFDLYVIPHKTNIAEYSYKNFIWSFKKNFEKHIGSLKKYEGEKNCAVFLIEHDGALVTVLRNEKFSEFYKIKYDKELLSYIYNFDKYLSYIIYLYNNKLDIINIKQIPEYLKNAPENITFGAGRYLISAPHIFIDL